jgi:uncharacterized protein (DUF58 family)
MDESPLLDRHFLEKLERLTIHWGKSFPGLVGGHNPSRFAGGGQEFLDHRQFHQGDDLRSVNWRAYMRLDKMFLKMFQIEPRVPVRILLDTSLSMAAGDGSKFQYARKLAASLVYVGLVRHDMISVYPFASHLKEGKKTGGGRQRFTSTMDYFQGLKPGGVTDFVGMVREVITTFTQRGLIVLISDFLDDAGIDKGLQYLGDFGHELFLIQLWNEEDRTPPWTGELELEDGETNQIVKLQFDDDARTRYTQAFDEHCGVVQQLAFRSGGKYAGVSTAQPIEDVIFGSLVRSRGVA